MVLRAIAPFDQLTPDVVGGIQPHVTRRVLERGELLFTGQDEQGTLGVVAGGCLDVRVGTGAEEFEVAQVRDGEVVGEIAALLGGDRTALVRAAARSEVVLISREGVARLVERAPHVVGLLFDTATRRLRETQLAAVLADHFGSGTDGGRHPFVESVEWVSLKAGERLFAKGDASDAAYVLVSGRLREIDVPAEEQTVRNAGPAREIGAGELVGELTLLRSKPRMATVAATRDSTLARLPGDVFDRLAADHPTRMLGVVRAFLDGLLEPKSRRRPSALTLAVLAADESIDVHAWSVRLTRHLGSMAETVHLSAAGIDEQLEQAGIANSGADTPGDVRVRFWLDDAEKQHEIVVLEADSAWTPWTRRALGQADRVLVLADATSPDASIRPLESAVYGQFEASLAPPRTTLVLLHPLHAEKPTDTVRWLRGRPVADHLHVRRGDAAHVARLARFVSGRAVSLVLGGGGARGFAHLGVIRALRELGIPVDMVGASSIGSSMALFVAMEFGDEEMVAHAQSSFARLKDYTIPVVAVLRGRAITRTIEASTDGRDFEDCWVPFFCVSTSLTKAEDVVHRSGPMAPAIRASVSIPGVLPPVAFDGDVLIDGATINNLPVDRMREANPTGTIIAVDVSRTEVISAAIDFPPHVSGWSALRSRRKRSTDGASSHGIGATLMASSLVGANRLKNRQVLAQIADVYVSLDVQGLGLLDFSAENVVVGAQMGYERSFAQLRAWRDEHAATPPSVAGGEPA